MKFISGIVLGAMLTLGGSTMMAQNERALHPRIARAIEALRDARAYLKARRTTSAGTRRMPSAPPITRFVN